MARRDGGEGAMASQVRATESASEAEAARTVTSADLAEAVYRRVGLSRAESAELVQSFIEQNASKIAGKGPTGAIRAMQARSEADDQYARRVSSEGRHGTRPVARMVRANAR